MKIAFLFSEEGVRLPFDPANLWTDKRGLTGSELTYFMYATHLAKMGHECVAFSKFTGPGTFDGVSCEPYSTWSARSREHWDAVLAWNSPKGLSMAPRHSFKFFDLQISKTSPHDAGWEDYVDIIAPLSNTHAKFYSQFTPFDRTRWRIAPNGVDLDAFQPKKKAPGRLIWASSLDRGFHWVLESFGKIRAAVPWAELHVFYDFFSIEYNAQFYDIPKTNPDWARIIECGRRSRYILDGMQRFKGRGVVHRNSVSRAEMVEEMAAAEVLPYPLDPFIFTETFGVTVLEACAAGVIPVLCMNDAFPELWGTVAEGVMSPYADHKEEFVEKVIRALKDSDHKKHVRERCRQRAEQFSWKKLTMDLELCLKTRGERGLAQVRWHQ